MFAVRQLVSTAVSTVLLVSSGAAIADVKVYEGENGRSVSLGGWLQFRYNVIDSDIAADEEAFVTQRARLRALFNISEDVIFFTQTEASEFGPGPGTDLRIMSAWLWLRHVKEAQLFLGQHISSGGGRNAFAKGTTYFAGDIYNVAFKGLNLGTRAASGIFSSIIPQTDAGLRTDVAPRDKGVTLFGNITMLPETHLTYWLFANEGARSAQANDGDPRIGGRIQVNFGDPEFNPFPIETWLGRKQTLAIGLSYERQDDVGFDTITDAPVDYEFWTADIFVERDLGPGTLNVEAAYMDLDLGGGPGFISQSRGGAALGPATATAQQAQGDGGYISAGYLQSKWQPYVGVETWESDDPNGIGSFDGYRLGVNYYAGKDYSLVYKAGFASDDLDWTASTGAGMDDSINTFLVGVYAEF